MWLQCTQAVLCSVSEPAGPLYPGGHDRCYIYSIVTWVREIRAGKRDFGEMQKATKSQVSANSAARSKVIILIYIVCLLSCIRRKEGRA